MKYQIICVLSILPLVTIAGGEYIEPDRLIDTTSKARTKTEQIDFDKAKLKIAQRPELPTEPVRSFNGRSRIQESLRIGDHQGVKLLIRQAKESGVDVAQHLVDTYNTPEMMRSIYNGKTVDEASQLFVNDLIKVDPKLERDVRQKHQGAKTIPVRNDAKYMQMLNDTPSLINKTSVLTEKTPLQTACAGGSKVMAMSVLEAATTHNVSPEELAAPIIKDYQTILFYEGEDAALKFIDDTINTLTIHKNEETANGQPVTVAARRLGRSILQAVHQGAEAYNNILAAQQI